MAAEEALSFLRNTPPFSSLDEQVLKGLVEEMVAEEYPKGRTILHQNGPAADHLIIIRSGAIKVFVSTNEGEEILVDSRTAGDFFGLLSFACGDVSRDTAVAVEDTSCLLVRKETVLRLLKTNAQFCEFCFRTRLKRLLDMTYREIQARTLLYGGGDKLLFTNILSDLATKTVITASEDITIKEAADIMSARKISSLVLLDLHGFPVGMVTDRDLRGKVVSKGRDVTTRVSDIMSVTLVKSEASDYCFEALLKMMRYNIHHLLVVDKGEMKGIITNHDLMMLQGTSPLSLAGEIEHQDTIDGLAASSGKISKTITVLIREGAKASHITRIITEINDRLLKRILEITEARVGPPPRSYCWIVYGSEGRKEQTFRTDQDNAIIYEDSEISEEQARTYFSTFAAAMKDALARCGFPPCSADYMASNPKWCQPLSVWKNYFKNWITSPTPEAILQSLIFFDFRGVHGNVLLAEHLRTFLSHEIKDNGLFLAHMADVVLKNSPPLDLFGRFKVAKKGPHKGAFNLKINGLCPVIDMARLSALGSLVYYTSTIARLRALESRDAMIGAHAHDLEQVFESLMSLRLRHQFEQVEKGVELDNFINPDTLGLMEKRMLREAFKLILSVQKSVSSRYGAWMIR